MRNVKDDFPIFKERANRGLVYLDSTATTLKPKLVLDAQNAYYQKYSANVFRGFYKLSEKATRDYEAARQRVAQFINAQSQEVIFVRNTTEALNLIAYSWGRMNVQRGDRLIVSIMEHHSNFVPWQMLAFENDAVLYVIGITTDGRLKIGKDFDKLITKNTKLVALTHVSNVLGTINQIKELTTRIKKINPNCLVVVDGAQAVPHMKIDVRDLGVDFYAFSGHKMLGPTGIGVLWGRLDILKTLAAFIYGGEMITEVSLYQTTFKDPPHRFEAGTPAIAEAIGLGAAVDYLNRFGMDKVREYEVSLTNYAIKKLRSIPGLIIYGPREADYRGGVIAFNMYDSSGKMIHPHDVADILSQKNICIRAGHHCAMPLHTFLGVSGSCRASFYIYSKKEDVDVLIDGLKYVYSVFSS